MQEQKPIPNRLDTDNDNQPRFIYVARTRCTVHDVPSCKGYFIVGKTTSLKIGLFLVKLVELNPFYQFTTTGSNVKFDISRVSQPGSS